MARSDTVPNRLSACSGRWRASWPRATHRHSCGLPEAEPQLVGRIEELATRHGRCGYRRIMALLREEGWRREYNTLRRNSAIGYRPPAPEAQLPWHPAPTLFSEVSMGLTWKLVRKPGGRSDRRPAQASIIPWRMA